LGPGDVSARGTLTRVLIGGPPDEHRGIWVDELLAWLLSGDRGTVGHIGVVKLDNKRLTPSGS